MAVASRFFSEIEILAAQLFKLWHVTTCTGFRAMYFTRPFRCGWRPTEYCIALAGATVYEVAYVSAADRTRMRADLGSVSVPVTKQRKR